MIDLLGQRGWMRKGTYTFVSPDKTRSITLEVSEVSDTVVVPWNYEDWIASGAYDLAESFPNC